MSTEDNVITEQPISCEKVEDTEFSLFGKSKSEAKLNLDAIGGHDSLVVKQQLDVIGSACDKCCCCDKLNKYKVKDSQGKTILTAVEEEESCCAVECCRRGRRFEMKLKDKSGQQVMRLKLKNDCCGQCCCFCRYPRLQVYAPFDTQIGSIEESWNCFHKQLKIYTASASDPIYTIDGPNCESCRCCRCCSDFTFAITKYETGEECGSIAKKWSGFAKETMTTADNFKINFPKNIELNEKAILLATCIMIDLMYFETKRPDKDGEDSD